MTEPQPPPEQPPDKQKQRRARKSLSEFLTRLRKACDTVSTINDWVEITGQANEILNRYQAEIPLPNRQRLADALAITETSREAISQACDVLQVEIKKTIEALPKGGCSCGCLAGGALLGLVAGVLLVAGAFTLFLQPAEVVVVNQGCRTFQIREGVPPGLQPVISLLGIDLPEEIHTGEQGVFGIPGLPVSVGIDGTSGRAVRFSSLGVSQTFNVSPDVVFIEIDGQPILGNAAAIDLQDRNPHTVLIACE